MTHAEYNKTSKDDWFEMYHAERKNCTEVMADRMRMRKELKMLRANLSKVATILADLESSWLKRALVVINGIPQELRDALDGNAVAEDDSDTFWRRTNG